MARGAVRPSRRVNYPESRTANIGAYDISEKSQGSSELPSECLKSSKMGECIIDILFELTLDMNFLSSVE